MTVENEAGDRKSLGTREVMATEASQIVMGDFLFRPEQAGQYRIRVKAEGQPGETIDNNESTAFLTVRDGGLRALLLSSGALAQEQKFIRRSLDESPDIELDYEQLNLKGRKQWPVNLSRRQLQLEDYDVFIIGDLDARAVRPEDWEAIAQLWLTRDVG